MFIDANKLDADAFLEADVCIVGCGAAGIAMAKELDGTDLRVIILEAGGFEFNPGLEEAFYELDDLQGAISDDLPTRRMQFGGATNAWFGRIALLDEIDFSERSWVPDSGWPINSAEISQYYRRAAATLGVNHLDKMQKDAWRDNATHQTFTGGGLDTGMFFWAEHMHMGPTYRKMLAESTNVQVYLHASVQSLGSEHGLYVRKASVRGLEGNSFTVNAGEFVLACGGHEAPRLLLLSNKEVAAGLGNQYDNVGRYLVDHPRSEGLAHITLKDSTPQTLAKVATLGEKSQSKFGKVQMHIKFSEQQQEQEHLLNHCVHAHLIRAGQESAGWNALRQLLSRDVAAGARSTGQMLSTIARELPQLIRYAPALLNGSAPVKMVGLVDQMEQEPNRESRVCLSEDRQDPFGNPLAAVDWRISKATQRSWVRMHELIGARVLELDIGRLESPALDNSYEPVFFDMKHPGGTTRMSARPQDGVVDADCSVHGVANLSIVGNSVFPTGGHANPTFTIVALAIRLADRLKKQHSAVGILEGVISAEY